MSFADGLGSGLGSATGEAIAPSLVAAMGTATPTTLEGRLAASQANQFQAKDSLASPPTTGVVLGLVAGGFVLFALYLIMNDQKQRRKEA